MANADQAELIQCRSWQLGRLHPVIAMPEFDMQGSVMVVGKMQEFGGTAYKGQAMGPLLSP